MRWVWVVPVAVRCTRDGRIAIKRTIHPFEDDVYPLAFWFTYLIVVIMLISLVVSVIYLNKAVSAFSVNLVTPILYVEFTVLSITGSAILYREWSGLDYTAIISMIVGFFVVIIGAHAYLLVLVLWRVSHALSYALEYASQLVLMFDTKC